jgi:hypothetical protein
MRNHNLEKVLNGWPWAYTGSVAMKIHANRLGKSKNMRPVGNINIAIDPNNFKSIFSSLRSWEYANGPPGPNSKRARMFRMTPNGKRINMNVIKANGALAPKFSHVQRFRGLPPVMSVQALLNQKRKVNRNDVFGNNIRKLNQNIKFLKELNNIERGGR